MRQIPRGARLAGCTTSMDGQLCWLPRFLLPPFARGVLVLKGSAMSVPTVRSASKVNRRGSRAIPTVGPLAPGGVGRVAVGDGEIEPEEIAILAYSYWEARDCQGGSPEEDWLRAEQQLRAGNRPAGGRRGFGHTAVSGNPATRAIPHRVGAVLRG
jgi:hypothetical protein